MSKDDGVFGEISFLEGVSATASVVADEDETAVYIIEGTQLFFQPEKFEFLILFCSV